jgi:uncharacterized protein (DUF1778 family)
MEATELGGATRRRAARRGSTARGKTAKVKATAKPQRKRAQAGRAAAAPKATPMSFRMDALTRDLVDRAATATGQNRTDFMLMAMRDRAIEVLLNRRLFVLNGSDWAAFVERLDNPPPPNAKLKALLARECVWD